MIWIIQVQTPYTWSDVLWVRKIRSTETKSWSSTETVIRCAHAHSSPHLVVHRPKGSFCQPAEFLPIVHEQPSHSEEPASIIPASSEFFWTPPTLIICAIYPCFMHLSFPSWNRKSFGDRGIHARHPSSLSYPLSCYFLFWASFSWPLSGKGNKTYRRGIKNPRWLQNCLVEATDVVLIFIYMFWDKVSRCSSN